MSPGEILFDGSPGKVILRKDMIGVHIILVCDNDYQSAVLYEDLKEKLTSGNAIFLTPSGVPVDLKRTNKEGA